MSALARTLVGIALGLAVLFGAGDAVPAKKAAATAGKAKKSGKKSKQTPQEIAGQVLFNQNDAVLDCAGKNALDKGANKVEIDIRVTINSSGQVVNIVTTVNVDKGDVTPVKGCVDALIKAIRFPAIPAPLTTIERNWTIQSS